MRTFRFESDGQRIPRAPTMAVGSEVVAGAEWDEWLKSGETISLSEWEVSPAGLTLSDAGLDQVLGMTWVKLSGGTAGVTYTLTNKVTTTGTDVMPSVVEPRSMYVKVVPRK